MENGEICAFLFLFSALSSYLILSVSSARYANEDHACAAASRRPPGCRRRQALALQPSVCGLRSCDLFAPVRQSVRRQAATHRNATRHYKKSFGLVHRRCISPAAFSFQPVSELKTIFDHLEAKY